MKIEVTKLYADSGDCDLGCWNSAEGYDVVIDGVQYNELHPFASCCSSSNFTEEDLLNLIFREIGQFDIEVSYESL
ncbi:hypothetical protein ACQ31_gp145 [Salmonella phage STML-198]|uniref:Uncharacterized protein n=2 Tax=Gelderlandvirus TaxID=1913653 RepID=K4I2R4_9CAUD|nr:hypothetical protein ACQ31_gp145 [Salmonella phage STML-198]YP_009615563.1 hypothetical protein FDI73_gp077 [Salmonella phage Melville]AFU64028.1 hypothetical protein [Salmonella phage STML-198]ATN93051.1 hypothetical protein CPT_Melville_077 [Salmonella phage Melville]UPW42452.1 hypothetical protein EBPHNEJP_00154 [Salmonella phage CF-SP2]